MQVYSDPKRENDPHSLPNIEVFEVVAWTTTRKPLAGERPTDADGNYLEPGWYWQARFPGCLPDGDQYGPFNTSEEAIASAQEDQ